MRTYKIKWSDGNGAASRGMDIDNVDYTTINANNDEEALTIAYILRCFGFDYLRDYDGFSVDGIDDPKLKEALSDYGYEDDEIEELFSQPYTESDLDRINMDGIDGGDPWIISIEDESEILIYDNTVADIYDQNDIVDRMNELPTTITIPKQKWEEWLDDDDVEDIEKSYIVDFLNDFAEDDLGLDLSITDFGECIGNIRVDSYEYTLLPNGDAQFKVEWEQYVD